MSSSKSSRKDKDRRGDDEYSSSRRDVQKPKPMLDEFFLDGEGIDREVLQSSICRFLGPEATCRPFDHEGRRGFKIRAIRTFTPPMLQDLKERSAEFRDEAQSRRQRGGTGQFTYAQSETRQRRDDPGSDVVMDLDPVYPSGAQHGQGVSGIPYSQGPNPSAYGARYPQDPSVSYATTNPNVYAPTYPNHAPTGNPGMPYMENYHPSDHPPYGSNYPQQGNQWPGYDQGYGSLSRNPNVPPYSAYGDPSGAMTGGPNNYTVPQQQPRIFNDPYSPDPRDPRSMNPPRDFPYPPPGSAGPATYGQNPRDPRDRDPRDIRDSRDVRDTRDTRDYNSRPSSDYPPPSRRR